MKYLVTDVETGGFEGTSLLSAYFGVLDENLNLLDELELFVRPDNRQYVVTAEALAINKINLIEHEKKAVTYKEAGTLLFNFLQKNSTNVQYINEVGIPLPQIAPGAIYTYSNKPAILTESTITKLEPIGHNVAFDIQRIKKDLISEGSWLKFVSYRVLDTGVIGNYLKKKGRIPSEISGSLSSYADHFGIDKSKAHDAKGDCEMTVEVFKHMLRL